MRLSDAIDPAVLAGIEARFWPKVDKQPKGCWNWTAAKVNGYGQLAAPGGSGNPIRAHRLSLYLTRGPLPEGLVIDHLCKNRACVNPAHLDLVTGEENNRRAAMVRRKATHCPRGHAYLITYAKRGRRTVCKPCHNEASRKHYLKKKGERCA